MTRALLPAAGSAEVELPRVTILAGKADLSFLGPQGVLATSFDCSVAQTEADARSIIVTQRPDLLLIAWSPEHEDLPGIVARLRESSRTRYLPVVAWGDERAWLSSPLLSGGSVDEVISDLSRAEIGIAALRALLRRVRPEALTGRLEFADLTINELERRVEWDGSMIHLSPTEYRLLASLVDEPSHMLTREQILRRVWGHVSDTSRQIDQVVKGLRLLLRPLQAEHLIETVRGIGYRLAASAEPERRPL
ncbi:winged helix-turn-helix domain-containing protein [Frigidibacter sp.]|uniref:winged helix-turn-helix domain-containing protein n=1 Tax=Frigidibacter sp. TaxID=2586418 RepID=UPI00273563D0|nr:winged helix-turn-helix domain-containing protein [Frigidibacter sp.]MDP3340519.1 winged helix-turn-helix domain-containing protein [Frigidibacter sp.]